MHAYGVCRLIMNPDGRLCICDGDELLILALDESIVEQVAQKHTLLYLILPLQL